MLFLRILMLIWGKARCEITCVLFGDNELQSALTTMQIVVICMKFSIIEVLLYGSLFE